MSSQNTIIKAAKWSAIEKLTAQLVQFIVSIVIARLLSPSDYGIIGMISILLGISQSFIDCGFSQALIHKTNRTESDCSTIFFFNILVGLSCYGIIYVSAPYIADFYNMPILTDVTRIISLSIPIRSLTLVQIALLNSKTDFKSQTFATLPAALLSGLIGIILAYNKYGVWALVWQELGYLIIFTLIICIITKWKPILTFSKSSFKELFSYGSKLLFSGLIDTIYSNSFALVIGKFYSSAELGNYSKAKTFPYFISVNLSSILQRAIFPILCQFQNDDKTLIARYNKYLRTIVTITTPLILGLCALAHPTIEFLLTDKWLDAAPLLQILCLFYLLSPITMINNSMYQVKGHTGLFLKLEIIKKIIGFACLAITIPFGVKYVCIGSVIGHIICLSINIKILTRIINISVIEQIKNIVPIFFIGGIMAYVSYTTTFLFSTPLIKIAAGVTTGIITYCTLNYFFNRTIFFEIINKIIMRKK